VEAGVEQVVPAAFVHLGIAVVRRGNVVAGLAVGGRRRFRRTGIVAGAAEDLVPLAVPLMVSGPGVPMMSRPTSSAPIVSLIVTGTVPVSLRAHRSPYGDGCRSR
jgi:hypothetical protein